MALAAAHLGAAALPCPPEAKVPPVRPQAHGRVHAAHHAGAHDHGHPGRSHRAHRGKPAPAERAVAFSVPCPCGCGERPGAIPAARLGPARLGGLPEPGPPPFCSAFAPTAVAAPPAPVFDLDPVPI